MHYRTATAAPMLATLLLIACTKEAPKQEAKALTKVAPPPPPAPLVVRIGLAAPLTGPLGAAGLSAEHGARLALDEANAARMFIKGGQAVQFELISADDQATPAKATEVAQALVARQIHAVIGHLGSEASLAAGKSYEEAKIPQVSLATGSALTARHYRSAFRVTVSDRQQAEALGRYATESLHAKKIAVISDGTGYGVGLADEFKKTIAAAGAQVVTDERVKFTDSRFDAIVSKIKRAQADAVLFAGLDYQAAPLAVQLHKAHLQLALLTPDGACTDELLHTAGAAAEGQHCTRNGLPVDQMAGAESFVANYRAKFTSEPTVAARYAYDAAKVLVDAVRRAESVEPEKLRSALASTTFKGLTGTIAFDADGNNKNGTVSVYAAKDGGWSFETALSGAPNNAMPAPAAEQPLAAPALQPAPKNVSAPQKQTDSVTGQRTKDAS